MGSTTEKRILLLSHARTASHLLERVLSNQPNVAYAFHPFAMVRPLQVQLLEQGPLDQASQASKDQLLEAWQAGAPTWEDAFASAHREHKDAFLHCHPHFMLQPSLASAYVHGTSQSTETEDAWVLKFSGDATHSRDNPTVLPDAQLLAPGTVPIFTIRNPATMVPSIYRTIRDLAGRAEKGSTESMVFSSTLRWQRLMYDWYVKHGKAHGIEPIIVDADDYQGSSREAYLGRLCDKVGLDKQHLVLNWSKTSDKELSEMIPLVAEIKKTLLGSSGFIEGLDTNSLDLKAEEAKWVETFGEKGAKEVKDLVERTRSEYEYLKARKFV